MILNGEAGEKQEGIDLVYVETHLAVAGLNSRNFKVPSMCLKVSVDSREVIWYLLMNRAQQGLEAGNAWSALLEGVEPLQQSGVRHQVISLALQLNLL